MNDIKTEKAEMNKQIMNITFIDGSRHLRLLLGGPITALFLFMLNHSDTGLKSPKYQIIGNNRWS